MILGIISLTAHAQFTFITNGGAITITDYNTNAGLDVVIPASTNGYPITTIGANAFNGKTTITNVTIQNSVTVIGSGAFTSCFRLATVTIPSSVTTIGGQAFQSCKSLTGITIPNSVSSIGISAFASSGLTSVTIPSSVTVIGFGAFTACSSLTSVTVLSSANNIGTSTFASCTNLHQAYFLGSAPQIANNTVFSGETGTVFFPPGTPGWSSTFGGWPTAAGVYQPQPRILGTNSNLGLSNNLFSFTITWATNASVVVLASTNLLDWTPLSTNSLVSGTNVFSDGVYANFPSCYYRVRSY